MKRSGYFVVISLLLIALAALLFDKDNMSKIRSSGKMLKLPPVVGPKKIDPDVLNSKGNPDTIYHTIPEFSFLAHTGDSISSKDFEHTLYVANFFFASCPGICPKLSSSMERIQNTVSDDVRFKLISHTVDPETDSLSVLKAYAEQYGANPGQWFLVRGDRASVNNIAVNGYLLPRPGKGNLEHAFIHSERLVLIDHKGRIRGFYDGTVKQEVNNLMRDLVLIWRHEGGEEIEYQINADKRYKSS